MATDLPRTPTPHTVDLTGLSEETVRQVMQLVHNERRKQAENGSTGSASDSSLSLPLPPDQWRAELAAWKQDAERRADRYPAGHVLDDSRDTIYDDRDRV